MTIALRLPVIGLTVLASCSTLQAQTQKPTPLDKNDPGYVTAQSLTTAWPLTVQEVVLRCQKISSIPVAMAVTVRTAGGQEYALNASAKSRGFQSFDPIWANNPKLPGTKINATQLIALGLRLCD